MARTETLRERLQTIVDADCVDASEKVGWIRDALAVEAARERASRPAPPTPPAGMNHGRN